MTKVILDQGAKVLGIGELSRPVEWLAFHGEDSSSLRSFQFEDVCALRLEYAQHLVEIRLPIPEADNLIWSGALSSESGHMILTLTTGEEATV